MVVWQINEPNDYCINGGNVKKGNLTVIYRFKNIANDMTGNYVANCHLTHTSAMCDILLRLQCDAQDDILFAN